MESKPKQLQQLSKDIVSSFEPEQSVWSSNTYDGIYQIIKDEAIEFQSKDLLDFIMDRGFSDIKGIQDMVLGLYTGALLHDLTERNRERKRLTHFYFDGKGKKFPHLFEQAREIDGLVLDNFNGSNICNSVGSYGGHVGFVVINRNNGGCSIEDAGHGGTVNLIAIFNSQGNCSASSLGGWGASIGLVAVINNKGNQTCWHSPKSNDDYIDTIFMANTKGDSVAKDIGYEGIVNIAIAYNHHGEMPFVVHNSSKEKGKVNLAYLINSQGKSTQFCCPRVIDTLVVYNSKFEGYFDRLSLPDANKVIEGGMALHQYTQLAIERRLNEMLEIAESSKNGFNEGNLEKIKKLSEFYGLLLQKARGKNYAPRPIPSKI